MEKDILYLIVYSIIWMLSLIYWWKKDGIKNTGVLLIAFYAIISILAIHLYSENPYGELHPWFNISLYALLYLFFFIYIFCTLLLKPSKAKILIDIPNKYLVPLYIFVIIFSLLDIVPTIKNFRTGLFLMMMDSQYGNILYQESTLEGVHTAQVRGAISFIGVFSNFARNLAPVMLLYSLANKNSNKYIVFGLLLATFTTYMTAISLGLRSIIVQNLLTFIFLFSFLYKFYSVKVKKIIIPVLSTMMGIIILGGALITSSRVDALDTDASTFVESYASQSVLYFGCYGFDNGNQIRNGDRTFPLIKSFFSDDVARSTFDRRQKYQSMYINESVFTTFVGDFVFDFGIIGGACVMLSMYFLFKILLSKISHHIHFHDILIVYLLIYMLCGFYLYPLSDFVGNIMLIGILIISCFYRSIVHEQKIYK